MMRGPEIEALQQSLKELGLKINVDGIFGINTRN
jgi:peptidoglycan hydrolase-like protein with peptidoglycan-binding domain